MRYIAMMIAAAALLSSSVAQGAQISGPPLTETVKLPNWTQSDRMIWPPPKVPLAELVAESMTPPDDPRFGPNWAVAREQDMARRAATEARWAKEEEARQAESRRAYEASLRR